MKKRILAALLTLAMTAAMVTGCSTPSTGGDSGEGGGDSGAASGEKVFRYATNTEPTTLDPTKGQSIGDNEIQDRKSVV